MQLSQTLELGALVLSLSRTTSAFPHATLEALPTTCASYPSYNSTTDTAGPWNVVADSTGTPINGGSASIVSFTNDGNDLYGFITLPQTNPNFGAVAPKISLRCSQNKLQAQLRDNWVDISIAGDENWQHSLAFGLPEEGIQVQPYARVVNGTKVPGVFLGAKESTRWFFKNNWGGNAGDYFLLRWQEEAEAGKMEGNGKRQSGPIVDDRDWYGYLKIET